MLRDTYTTSSTNLEGDEMQFEIHPLKGVNSIEFGMIPDQVRQAMGQNFTLFKRGGNVDDDDGRHPSDYYADEGVFFYYTSDGHLEAIEFAPSAMLSLGGVNFFDLPIKEAAEALRRIDPEMKLRQDIAYSHGLGLCLWTPDGWYDEEKHAWREEEDDDDDDDDDDWEPEEPKVGSILIAPPGGLDYLDKGYAI